MGTEKVEVQMVRIGTGLLEGPHINRNHEIRQTKVLEVGRSRMEAPSQSL